MNEKDPNNNPIKKIGFLSLYGLKDAFDYYNHSNSSKVLNKTNLEFDFKMGKKSKQDPNSEKASNEGDVQLN